MKKIKTAKILKVYIYENKQASNQNIQNINQDIQ